MTKIDKNMLMLGAAAGVIVVLLVTVGSMVNSKWDQLNQIHDQRVSDRAQQIEDIKNDCKLIHKDIDKLVSATYTYHCKDGIDYSFSEEI